MIDSAPTEDDVVEIYNSAADMIYELGITLK